MSPGPRGAGLSACVRGGYVTNSATDESGTCPNCSVAPGGLRKHQPTKEDAAASVAQAIGAYMETRSEPWPDVAAMRDAVDEAVRLALFDAHAETRAALRVIHGY